MDILQHEKHYKVYSKSEKSFEVVGLSVEGVKVYLHLREEVTSKKDRKLFFVSCYYKKTTSPP